MNFIYILYFLLSPIIFLILIVASLFNKKIYEHLINQKRTINDVLGEKLQKPIIFHAASAGEFEQIKPLLRDRPRGTPIIQTFFSPTIYNKENQSKLFDVCCYHPFDFPWSAYSFFKKIKPQKYIVNRHDIWPHHILIAKLLGIKIIYINANLKPDSLRLNIFLKNFNKWLFKKIDFIIAPSQKIKKRFIENFEIQHITVLQDTRFIQIQSRIDRNKEMNFLDSLSKEKTLILGSIDTDDWNIIFNSIKEFHNKDFNIIIVPHEIDNKFINQVCRDIKELKLSVKRFTDMNNNDILDFVIYDKVGDLLDIYKYGDFAYVGCGFSTGVHSVLEPALQGCYISHGANISLLDEAIKLSENKLSKIIYNSSDFTDFLKNTDTIFLEKNKNKVFDLFKINYDNFNDMKKIIYET